ncbi:MAG TPA: GPW/gp25 family protein [Methylomirabilota bacterium]|nr:GPW/gp25 family protein [Methylomirabilota bacterium]
MAQGFQDSTGIRGFTSSRRSSRITRRSKLHEFYSDFKRDFDLLPQTGGLERVINEQSIVQSIENLVNTRRGERFYQPNVGSDVQNSLFDLFSDLSGTKLNQSITNVIAQFEPRASNVQVQVIPDITNNAYVVNIAFTPINIPHVTTTMQIVIARAR